MFLNSFTPKYNCFFFELLLKKNLGENILLLYIYNDMNKFYLNGNKEKKRVRTSYPISLASLILTMSSFPSLFSCQSLPPQH